MNQNNDNKMPTDADDVKIPVFTPRYPDPVVTITAAGDVDVTDYESVMFSINLDIYFGTDAANPYPWPANIPIGIAPGLTTIHVNAACAMAVM